MNASEVVGPIVSLCGVVVLVSGVMWGLGDLALLNSVSTMAYLIAAGGVLLLGIGIASWSDIV